MAGCHLKISKWPVDIEYQMNIKGISKEYQRILNIKGISKDYQRNIKGFGISKEYQRNIKGISKEYHRNIKGISQDTFHRRPRIDVGISLKLSVGRFEVLCANAVVAKEYHKATCYSEGICGNPLKAGKFYKVLQGGK